MSAKPVSSVMNKLTSEEHQSVGEKKGVGKRLGAGQFLQAKSFSSLPR